jgi:hypothetical protein
MPELSQRTLGKVIFALNGLVPNHIVDFPRGRMFWRTKLFEAGFPDWFIQWAMTYSMNWSVIVIELFHGRVSSPEKAMIGQELCHQMLRKLTVLAISGSKDRRVQEAIRKSLRSDGFGIEESIRAVAAPKELAITSDIVEAALRDAETLIHSSGPSNALDRVHTAFHGYLKRICEEQNIIVSDAASITTLFAQIRQKHPKLKIADPQADRMALKVLRSMAQTIDALNPVRNEKSLAHPNTLLDAAEAMLAINALVQLRAHRGLQ